MISQQQEKIVSILSELYNEAKHDQINIMKGLAKSMFRPMRPMDFKDAFLSISKEQGEGLSQLIIDNNVKNIVEFGSSFGISTLFLAKGAMETGGHITTTELIESKALRAIENFKKAGVTEVIEVKIGDALETLKNHDEPIDLLVLDGWKDMYLHLFEMLESNFHANTFVYVDNAEMDDVRAFLNVINQNQKYHLQPQFGGKVVLIEIKK